MEKHQDSGPGRFEYHGRRSYNRRPNPVGDAAEMDQWTSFCCCCLSNKVGTIIIGGISLVGGFSAVVWFCLNLVNIDEVKQSLISTLTQYQVDVANNFIVEHISNINIVCLTYYGIYTFTALFMTYGACMPGEHKMLLPWMLLEVVNLALHVAGIVVFFMYGRDPAVSSLSPGAYGTLGLLLIILFGVHFHYWLCPMSLYQSLKDNRVEQEDDMPEADTLRGSISSISSKCSK